MDEICRGVRLEIDRPGPSYTIDTLQTLAETLAPSTLYFITGADALDERTRRFEEQCRYEGPGQLFVRLFARPKGLCERLRVFRFLVFWLFLSPCSRCQ